jgi:hypothetical protein
MNLVGADRGPHFSDYRIGNDWPTVAEMDYPPNAPGMADTRKVRSQFESREEIARKQGLGEPYRPAPRGALESYARHIHLDAHFLP